MQITADLGLFKIYSVKVYFGSVMSTLVNDTVATENSSGINSSESTCCNVCKEKINDSRSSSISCSSCNMWSHVKCTMGKEVFDTYLKVVKAKKPLIFSGLLAYLCTDCKDLICKIPTSSKITQTSVQSTASASSNVTKPTVDTSPVVTIANTVVKETEVKKSKTENATLPKKQICYYYRHGKCRHGKSGKKMVDGKVCDFLHPNKCIRFCRFGKRRPNGCDGSCNFFHPKLCWSSVQDGVCHSPNCTLEHLQGTQRYQYPSFQQDRNQNGISNAPLQHHNLQERKTFQEKNPFYQQPKNQIRRQNQIFSYNQNDFPPLSNAQEDKISGLASAVQHIQSCVEYLMKCQYNVTHNQPEEFIQTQATSSSMPSHGNQSIPVHVNPILQRSQMAKN